MDEQERLTLAEWVQGVYERNRRLTAELVREAARPADSPAHNFVFGLAPAEAAEEFYLARARRLIGIVRVRVAEGPGPQTRRVRFWHAIPAEGTPPQEPHWVYENLDVLRGDAEKFKAARGEVVRRLRGAERALSDLELSAPRGPAAGRTRRASTAVRKARRLVEEE
jgi:hypothetical protein